MLDCFITRGILTEADRAELLEPAPVFERPALDVFHPIDFIAASRGGAYRFLDDNRAKLLIPAQRGPRRHRDRPRQQVDAGRPIAARADRRAICLARGAASRRGALRPLRRRADDDAVRRDHGARPERQPDTWVAQAWQRSVGTNAVAVAEQAAGAKRRAELLETIAARVESGMIGKTIAGELGLIERASPPFGTRKVDGTIRFELSPHFSIRGDAENDNTGDRQWQISF